MATQLIYSISIYSATSSSWFNGATLIIQHCNTFIAMNGSASSDQGNVTSCLWGSQIQSWSDMVHHQWWLKIVSGDGGCQCGEEFSNFHSFVVTIVLGSWCWRQADGWQCLLVSKCEIDKRRGKLNWTCWLVGHAEYFELKLIEAEEWKVALEGD